MEAKIVPPEPHGLVCHYFHGPSRPVAQGSLSADDFRRLLDAYGDRLISAYPWKASATYGMLGNKVAVTFDDGLREQVDIALPVLDEYRLRAFWYIYTQPYTGVPHSLETYRWIRNHAYGDVQGFYEAWAEVVHGPWYDMPDDYLADRTYLTKADRYFRYWRNAIATADEYARVMAKLAVGAPALPANHWILPSDLKALHRAGHVLGFHTHTHPTTMAHLSAEQTAVEYATSRYILAGLLDVHPESLTTCSHPCGNLNRHAEAWMKDNGVTLGWGATMTGSLPFNAPRWSTGYWT